MQSDQRSGSDDSGPPADDSPASGTSQSNSARSSSAAGPSAASPSSADAAPSASGGKSDAPRPTPSVSDEPHEEFVIEEGVPENEELLRERIKTLVIGKPRDLADKSVFQHVSLVAFLAWVGLGADGLSSSCYGPAEAYLNLVDPVTKEPHHYLAIFLALATIITVFVISACYSYIIEEFPSGGGGYLVASKLLGPKTGVVAGCALMVDYVLTITVSIAAGTLRWIARKSPTARALSSLPSAPTLMDRTRWCFSTSVHCAMNSAFGTGVADRIPEVDCTVITATAAQPKAPAWSTARMSAITPAPPPGSSPPMASTHGIGDGRVC